MGINSTVSQALPLHGYGNVNERKSLLHNTLEQELREFTNWQRLLNDMNGSYSSLGTYMVATAV